MLEVSVGLKRQFARLIPQSIKTALKRFIYTGNARFCPICKSSVARFREFGVVPRLDAQCPICKSLERHRLLWRYLEDKTPFFRCYGAKMLHFAPEECLRQRFRQLIGPGYITADLFNEADVKVDITDMQFSSEEFDIVYCSHVLEHVPDDRKAMREICRVLKPDGWAIIMVPISTDLTVEDPTLTDPQERLRRFGQDDHVRRYGRDFVGRLKEAGFIVRIIAANDFLKVDEIVRISVGHPLTGEVFHCTKG